MKSNNINKWAKKLDSGFAYLRSMISKGGGLVFFLLVHVIKLLPFLRRYVVSAIDTPCAIREGKDVCDIVILGIDAQERKRFVSELHEERCVFIYPNTFAIFQCLFLVMFKPAVVIIPAGRSNQISHLTKEFLRLEKIPVLSIGLFSLQYVVKNIDVTQTSKFFPAVFYIGKKHKKNDEIVLILHHSCELMRDMAMAAKCENVVMLPSDKENEICLHRVLLHFEIKRCLIFEQSAVPASWMLLLKETGISISHLSLEEAEKPLVSPLTTKSPFPGASRTLLLNINKWTEKLKSRFVYLRSKVSKGGVFAFFLLAHVIKLFPFLRRYVVLAMDTPFAIGEGRDACDIVIFGMDAQERRKFISELHEEQCAFAYPNTLAVFQYFFLIMLEPSLAIIPAGRTKQVPRLTKEFLRFKKIPVLSIGLSSLTHVVKNIDIAKTTEFFPALFYTSKKHEKNDEIVLILHPSRELMRDMAVASKCENVVMLPSDKKNEGCLSEILRHVEIKNCLIFEQNAVPGSWMPLLKEAGVSVSYLSPKIAEKLLVSPLTRKPPFPGAPRVLLLNIKDPGILTDRLKDYHVFSLKNEDHRAAVNLLRNFTFVWVGDNVPRQVRDSAARNSLPVLHFCESVLSSYGWRKSYALPLWLSEVQGRRNVDAVRDMQITSFVQEQGERLCSPKILQEAESFYAELRSLQTAVYKRSVNVSRGKIQEHGKPMILALWQKCMDGLSLEDFILKVMESEPEGRILVLPLNGYDVLSKLSIPAQAKQRCVFLKHLADLDDYLENAQTVHVHGAQQGAEAVFLGKRTVAHVPAWYTGWGLTEDLFIQERPMHLTRSQLVAAAFLGTEYRAPYSFENITVQAALAFWYTRQRPDLGRFHEALQRAFRADARFGVLDMRVGFYNNPEIDPRMEEQLRDSIFGHIMADILSFSLEMPKLADFLSLFSPHTAMEVLFSLILQAYYQTNYEQLDYILHQCSKWFEKIYRIDDNDIVRFYEIYHDSVIRNWFHDSSPPRLRLPRDAECRKNALLFYARILVMCFAYRELDRLADNEASDCTPEWYASLLFSLYNNRRSEIKETSIEEHVQMRLKFFTLYRKARISQGKKDFSPLFVEFMQECLKENRARMHDLAMEFSQKNEDPYVDEDKYNLVLLVVNMLYDNLEYALARFISESLLPKDTIIKDKERIVSQKDKMRGQSAKKYRVYALKKNLETSIKRNNSTVRFDSKLARANDISIYRFYLSSAAIVNRAPTVRHPKGIVFFGNYGTFFSAILPVVLYSLRKRGYAVWPMFNNHIPLNVPLFHPLAKFAYALPHISGPLQLEWTLDYAHKRIEAVGVNFYNCFFEAVTILVRRYEFDWESPDIQRQFRRLLKKTDSVVAWIDKLCNTLSGMTRPPKVAVMSEFAYNLPESAIRAYLAQKGGALVHFVYYKNVANYDLVHSHSEISTKVSGLDMTLWSDCRLSFLPARSRFEPWYAQRKNDPAFLAGLENIRQELLANITETHDEMLDYLRGQKALGKRIICCLGRLLFDQAEHKPGGPIHEDISEWLRHSVEIASETPDIVMLIRPHPHEFNPTAAVRARQTLRDILPRELPPNVLYVNPLDMTVQSLIGIMDLAVLWLGTAVWELSALGVPCAVMSHAGYDQVPFNAIFPQSREEYVRLLKSPTFPQPDLEMQHRGAACLHYVRTANMTRPYPYAFVRGSNSFRTVPWYRMDLIEKFMVEGDENIDFVVDQITEGIPINSN